MRTARVVKASGDVCIAELSPHHLRHSVLVVPQPKTRLGLGGLGRRVPDQDERGRALLPRCHVSLVGMHRQTGDGLGTPTTTIFREQCPTRDCILLCRKHMYRM